MKNTIDNFDWETYINNYEDLRNAGIDTKEKAYKHWKNHGIKEGRTYLKNSDIKEYNNYASKADILGRL